MISISKIESLLHGLDYYTKDNYYSKEEQKEFTQWYGKVAEILGLKGKVSLIDFKKALIGISSDKLGEKDESFEEEKNVSDEVMKCFQKETASYINDLNISEQAKKDIKNIIDKITALKIKINKQKLEKMQNKAFSIINKETSLNLEEKTKIKNFLKSKMEIFRKPPSRRLGYDLTFSAPKSVSLKALLDGDKKIIEAHRGAVQATLKVVENEYSQIRVRQKGQSEREIEVTGKIAAATFEHDVSRKTDPQLHTHCVLMNFTKRKDGSWRSLHQDGFYYNSKKIGSIYQNELAKRIQALGYEIKLNDNGTFDIKGYSDEQLRQFSKRTEQLRELGARTQKQATKIIKKNRDRKNDNIPRDVLLKKWNEEAIAVGLKHPVPKIVTNLNSKIKNNKVDILPEIIANSVKDLTDREVSFKKSSLESSVLGKMLGQFEYKEVTKCIDEYLNANTKTVGTKNVPEYVPNHILALEQEAIDIMQRGKNCFSGIVQKREAQKITNELHLQSKAAGYDGLNEGQKDAIDLFLTSSDRIFAWQGVAGAGKSFSLGSACKIATENGFIVKGFAPSAGAKDVLAAEAKLSEAYTVASLIVKETESGRARGKEIWVVDEAGLLSAADAHALLKKAEIENARVLLVGDTKQLSSVGAGNPFKQLQENGIKTAYLNQGLRQKDHIMKKSVDLIADGKHKYGLEILDSTKKIYEVKSTEDIIVNMAKDYLSLNEKELKDSLFISSTNYEKEEITNIIRADLKTKNILKESVTATVYSSYDYNEHALKFANVYNINDVIIINKRSQGLKANKPYKISEINSINNSIVVQTENGNKEVNLSKIKCNLFKEENIELCIGDKLKWTRNHLPEKNDKTDTPVLRRINGNEFNISHIDPKENKATLEYGNGKKEVIDLSSKQFIDYSYVKTVFSSQGKTCDKVYASLTNVDRENFYVAVSRAKFDCKIYTKDKELLYKNVEKIGANKTAFEKISERAKQFFDSPFSQSRDLFNKAELSLQKPSLDISKIEAIKPHQLSSTRKKIGRFRSH